MSYNRILLLNPSYSGSHYVKAMRPPAGLGYLAETLKNNKIQYDVIDMGLGYSFKSMHKKINEFKPDLIGVSMMTFKHLDTYEMLNQIKKIHPDIPIVAGGPHISTLREVVLHECSAIDFGITLEGERTIIEFCAGKPLEIIKGLIYRKDDEIAYNGNRDFIKELDKIPFPTYEKFELNKYSVKEICIVSTRGCPYGCIYCPVHLAIGREFRVRSAQYVVEELEYWYNRGYRRFDFVDDNLTFYKDRVYEICNEIERRNLKGLELHCGNGIRADKVDRDLLKRMKDVGFNYIAFGVEGGNNKILKNLKKSEKIETIEQSIKDACELGFDVSLFFLIGSPGEKWTDLEDSVNLALKYPISDVRFYNIIPFPGTELYEWLQKNSYFIKNQSEYLSESSAWDDEPIFETPELSAKERKRAMEYTKSIRVQIRKKYLKHKFEKFGLFGRIGIDLYFSKLYQTINNNYLVNIRKFI